MDPLKLENQLCFPLYAVSKEVIRKYKPILDKLDLTYTQYITMMVLWEHNNINVKTLGEILYLDSGTLTPVLNKLEYKNYIQKTSNDKDKRNLVISITEEGKKLKEKAKVVPTEIGKCINLTQEESYTLYKLLYKMLADEIK